jgi:hypothetical protein
MTSVIPAQAGHPRHGGGILVRKSIPNGMGIRVIVLLECYMGNMACDNIIDGSLPTQE